MFTTPGLTPVTFPEELTVATEGLPLVHEPPAGVTDNVIVVPTHTLAAPMNIGTGFTDTLYCALHPPMV